MTCIIPALPHYWLAIKFSFPLLSRVEFESSFMFCVSRFLDTFIWSTLISYLVMVCMLCKLWVSVLIYCSNYRLLVAGTSSGMLGKLSDQQNIGMIVMFKFFSILACVCVRTHMLELVWMNLSVLLNWQLRLCSLN